jgi:sigma-B regulation protein RsbU (phosphoserine phosphatase)
MSQQEPRLFHTLRSDVERVLDDVNKRGVSHEVRRTFDELEQFYLSDDSRARLRAKSVVARWFYRIWWLVRGLLMKLTPARRVMLAVALVLLLMGLQHYRIDDEEVVVNFGIFGQVLLVIVLMLELKDKLIARDELEAGRAVQLALMPQQSPVVPGWDVWTYTAPANDVGGDLVDYLPLGDGRHAIALGDVAGKALPAALLAVKLQATLRALIPQFESLSDLGAGVNRILVRDGLSNRFATLVYLVFGEHTGDLRLLNAGHLPPLIARANTLEELPRGSIALGIMADAPFQESRATLADGDVLIAYSDGVTEAINTAGEFFGEERLRGAIQAGAGQPASEIGARILRSLESFVGDAPTHDDVSVVVLRKTTDN